MMDFRSETRRRLLAYYFTNPTAQLHVRELAAQLSVDHSNLSKELRRLETQGLLLSRVSGRQKYFELNRAYPLLEELRGIVMKTIGVGPVITAAIADIGGIENAWMYGSFASGQQDAASDIDVLIIGTPDTETLAKAIRRVSKQLGREINYTVMSATELKRRRTRKDPFLENVWQGKRIALKG
jgi:predicted nucleotidyltransferase